MKGIRFSSIAILLFWLWLLFDAYQQGIELPALLAGRALPPVSTGFIATFALISFCMSGAIVFSTRSRTMEDMPLITNWVDGRWGSGTYAEFNRRLRPVLLSILSSIVISISGFQSTTANAGEPWTLLLCWVFLGLAAGLTTALLVSYRYPPRLH